MELQPLDKLIVTYLNHRQNCRVIGLKNEANGTRTYLIEPLRVDFLPFTNGAKFIRVNTTDVEQNRILIEKH